MQDAIVKNKQIENFLSKQIIKKLLITVSLP